MSDELKDAPVAATAAELDGAALLANAIVTAINQNGPQKVPYGKHRRTGKRANPDGSPKPALTRRCFQNGRAIPEHNIDSVTIELLNMLKPGRFVDDLITVVIGNDQNGAAVDIKYNCKTADQRMAIGTRVGSFKGMLRRCIREAMAKEEAEKARIREMAKSKPRKVNLDILKDDDERTVLTAPVPEIEDDDYSV